jgi:ribosomal protein S18 acetylase RimI-like enzyme
MLGIDKRYRGQPADTEWRYSRQVMSHLIAEAYQIVSDWSGDPGKAPQWLVLQVHKENVRAIRFYEQCGFELIPKVVRSPGHMVMKLYIGE